MWPTMEFTAHDLVYNVLAVCQASIDDVKYSKKKKRKAGVHVRQREKDHQKKLHGEKLPGEKLSHIIS